MVPTGVQKDLPPAELHESQGSTVPLKATPWGGPGQRPGQSPRKSPCREMSQPQDLGGDVRWARRIAPRDRAQWEGIRLLRAPSPWVEEGLARWSRHLGALRAHPRGPDTPTGRCGVEREQSFRPASGFGGSKCAEASLGAGVPGDFGSGRLTGGADPLSGPVQGWSFREGDGLLGLPGTEKPREKGLSLGSFNLVLENRDEPS